MKKVHGRLKRWTALLLAAVLVSANCAPLTGFSSFADSQAADKAVELSGGAVTESEPETEAETEPETTVQETESETEPETTAQETESETEPETTAQETESETEPETTAQETEPETEQETTAQETESETEPETTAQETEPETTTAEPETESEPETEQETTAQETEPETAVMPEETRELSFELSDGTAITVSEIDEGALEGAEKVTAHVIEDNGAIEDSIAQNLKDGSEIADLISFDITLYDEDGYVFEPDGEVSVSISGISTDEDYDDVGIYHIQEKIQKRAMFMSRMGLPAANTAGISTYSMPAGAANGSAPAAYNAVDVSLLSDDVKESGTVSFKTGHFSTYTVVFIKNLVEYFDIDAVFVGFDNWGTSSDGSLQLPDDYNELINEDISFDSDVDDIKDSIRFPEPDKDGNTKVDLTRLITENGLTEIKYNGERYIFQDVTYLDGNTHKKLSSLSNSGQNYVINYDKLKNAVNKSSSDGNGQLYLWYQKADAQKIKVNVYLANADSNITHDSSEEDYYGASQIIRGVQIDTGDLSQASAEKIENELKEYIEILPDEQKQQYNGNYSFEFASLWHPDEENIEPGQGDDHYHKLDSARIMNSAYYVKVQELPDEARYSTLPTINLYFSNGKTLNFDIEGLGNGNSVSINGQEINSTSGDGNGTYSMICSPGENSSVSFSIELADSYGVNVSSEGESGSSKTIFSAGGGALATSYDSRTEGNKITEQAFTIQYNNINTNGGSITIAFSEIGGDNNYQFDYSSYNTGGHGVVTGFKYGQEESSLVPLPSGTNLVEISDTKLVLEISSEVTEDISYQNKASYMQSLVLNGQSINIPTIYQFEGVENGPEYTLIGDSDHVFLSNRSLDEESYNDFNVDEETGAIAKVKVVSKGWLENNQPKKNTYIITIEQIKGDIVLTEFRWTVNREGVFSRIDEGLNVYYDGFDPDGDDEKSLVTTEIDNSLGDSGNVQSIGSLIGFAEDRFASALGIHPEFGYYVGSIAYTENKEVIVDDSLQNEYKLDLYGNSKWYEDKIAHFQKQNPNDRDWELKEGSNLYDEKNNIQIQSKHIKYHFYFTNGTGLNPNTSSLDDIIDSQDGWFELTGGVDDNATDPITENPSYNTIQNSQKGELFIGWRLYGDNNTNLTVYKSGSYGNDSISRSVLEALYKVEGMKSENDPGTFIDAGEGKVIICLAPVFSDPATYHSTEYKISIQTDDEGGWKEQASLTAYSLNTAVITLDDVKKNSDVKHYVDTYGEEYKLSAESTSTLMLNQEETSKNIFYLRYTKAEDVVAYVKPYEPHGEISCTVSSTGDSKSSSTAEGIMLRPSKGEAVSIAVNVNDKYTIDHINIKKDDEEGEDKLLSDIGGSWNDNTYNFSFIADAYETTVTIYYAPDENEDHTPDGKQHIITFDASQKNQSKEMFYIPIAEIEKLGTLVIVDDSSAVYDDESKLIGYGRVTCYITKMIELHELPVTVKDNDLTDGETFKSWKVESCTGDGTEDHSGLIGESYDLWYEAFHDQGHNSDTTIKAGNTTFVPVIAGDTGEGGNGDGIPDDSQYRVLYYPNGGKWPDGSRGEYWYNGTYYSEGAPVNTLGNSAAIRENATIVGWTAYENDTDENIIKTKDQFDRLAAAGGFYECNHEIIIGTADVKLYAVWAEDIDSGDGQGDEIPDYGNNQVRVTFKIADSDKGIGYINHPDNYAKEYVAVPEKRIQQPQVGITDTSYMFVGFFDENGTQYAGIVPADNTEYTAKFEKDVNGDGIPDSQQYIISFYRRKNDGDILNYHHLQYVDQEKWLLSKKLIFTGVANDPESLTYYCTKDEVSSVNAPVVNGRDDNDKIFDYWGLGDTSVTYTDWKTNYIDNITPGKPYEFYINLAEDTNGNDIPDYGESLYVRYYDNDGTTLVYKDNNEYRHNDMVSVASADNAITDRANAVFVGWTIKEPITGNIDKAVWDALNSHSYTDDDGDVIEFVPFKPEGSSFEMHFSKATPTDDDSNTHYVYLYAVWAEDKDGEDSDHDGKQDGDGTADYLQKLVKLIFEGGAHGTVDGINNWYLDADDDVYPAAPNVTVTTDGYSFTGWDPTYPDAESRVSADGLEAGDVREEKYTAQYVNIPDTGTDPEEPDGGQGGQTGDGGQQGGSGHGSGGSGGSGGTGRIGYGTDHYTAGIDGNWRHMDNVDANAVLDEQVPEGAVPELNPEWHRWKFFLTDGSFIAGRWAYVANPYAVEGQPGSGWFYFEDDGLMRFGWLYDEASGNWYYMHAESDGMLGTMITGWHEDADDGRTYYLDPVSGAMKTGWQMISGKWYYFNPVPVAETWTYDAGSGIWIFNGSADRPYGSMYRDEETPDGYRVGSDGAMVE